MKYLTKRPTLFMWAVVVAMLVGKAGGSHGNGFHQWWIH
jgi:hypothetical protein